MELIFKDEDGKAKMGVIHSYKGDGEKWDWEGVPVEDYSHKLPGVSTRRFVSRPDGSFNFEMRYFELEPGACSNLEQHIHEHGVLILRGQGQVLLGEALYPIKFGDAIFIPANERHQFQAAANESLGFACVVLGKRLRQLAHELEATAQPETP